MVHRNLKPASILLQHPHVEKAEPGPKKESQAEAGLPAGTRAAVRSPAVLPKPGTLQLHPSAFFPRIIDWGLGRRPLEGDPCDLDLHCWSGEGRKPGLPYYLSPEQVWGRVKDIGPSCDVYALGAILFELLSGQPPHKSGQLSEVLDKIQTEETPLPESVAEGKYRSLARSGGDLELICRKCLRKDPKRRYATALDLAEDLWRYSQGQPIKGQGRGGKVRRIGLWVRRHGSHLMILFLILAGFVAVSIAYNVGQESGKYAPKFPQKGGWREEGIRLQNELQQAQQALQTAQYARQLALVQRDLDLGQLRSALKQLDGLPAGQRHWEWYYLHARAQQQDAQRKLLRCGSPVQALAYSPTGQYLAVGAGSELGLWLWRPAQRGSAALGPVLQPGKGARSPDQRSGAFAQLRSDRRQPGRGRQQLPRQ